MEYGQVIKEAFRIVLRNRFLWFFGVFAAPPSFNFSMQWSGDGDSTHVDAGVITAIVGAVLVVGLVVLVLSTLSQGALAESVAAIHRGERRSFRTAWRAARAPFWRVLGVAALSTLAFVAALLVLAVPVAGIPVATFALTHAIAARVLTVVGAVLVGLPCVVALFTAFTAVVQFGARAAVLSGTRVVASVRAGWAVARRNPLPAFLLLLIQQGITFGVFLVGAFAVAVASIPAIVLFAASGVTAGVIALGVTALAVVPALLALFGAVGAFGHALWTLGYLRLSE